MKLFFLNGPRQGTCMELTPPGVSIGREVDNDVQLLVTGVSRYHAKITFNGSAWSILDLGSTNGTRLNGKQISAETALTAGDSIVIGDQTLVFAERLAVPESKAEAPAPPSAPEQPPKPSVDLKSLETLFSKDRKKEEEKKGTAPAQKKFKLLYPVLVFALALIVLAVFVKLNIVEPKTENSRAAAVKKPDFVLSYQRTKTEPGNIFRFALTVENDTAFFTLDDLKYGRHFQKTIPSVPARATRDLRDAILATDFMKLQQDPEDVVTKDVDETRTLTIVQNNRQNTITVRNNFAKSSFEAIERAIDRFSDDNGLISVSMNVEEMKKYADLTFRKAEDLYKSYQAKPENLRQAISRYKLSMEYFEQFSPKPPEWDEARKHLAEAEQTFEKLRRDLEFNIQQFYKLRDYARASAECQKAMDLLGPDSKAYPKLKTYKLEFDRQLRKK